jgi:hypothetical protein
LVSLGEERYVAAETLIDRVLAIQEKIHSSEVAETLMLYSSLLSAADRGKAGAKSAPPTGSTPQKTKAR